MERPEPHWCLSRARRLRLRGTMPYQGTKVTYGQTWTGGFDPAEGQVIDPETGALPPGSFEFTGGFRWVGTYNGETTNFASPSRRSILWCTIQPAKAASTRSPPARSSVESVRRKARWVSS